MVQDLFSLVLVKVGTINSNMTRTRVDTNTELRCTLESTPVVVHLYLSSLESSMFGIWENCKICSVYLKCLKIHRVDPVKSLTFPSAGLPRLEEQLTSSWNLPKDPHFVRYYNCGCLGERKGIPDSPASHRERVGFIYCNSLISLLL